MGVTKVQLESLAVIAAILFFALLITYAIGQSEPNQLSRIPDQAAYEQGMQTNAWVNYVMKIIIAIAVLAIIAMELFKYIKISGFFRKKKAGE
jgi:hypothetical protein